MAIGTPRPYRAAIAATRELFFCGCFVLGAMLTAPVAGADAPEKPEAERLVAAAAQAKVAGDGAKAIALLHEAVRSDPENQLARWQLGQVNVDGKWLSVEEAQRRAAADPRQGEYTKRRGSAAANVADQMLLARWCRDNKLTDEAQLHWSIVLMLDPSSKEALRALDLKWKDGRLVSRNETDAQKQQAQVAKNAAKQWEPIISKWRRDVGGRDVAAHDAALAEIRSTKKLDVIPSLEAVTMGRDAYDDKHAEECLQIALAFLEALEKMPEQAATESLVRHAVFSYGNKARHSAIKKLKARPQTDYVPMLLSGLAMPLESSFNIRPNPDGSVFYSHTLFREGQESDWSSDLRLSAVQNDVGGRHYVFDVKTKTVTIGPPNGAWPAAVARKQGIAAGYANRYVNAAAATESQVEQLNDSTEAINSVIMQVLAGATGQELETPRAWWDWWRNQNEYYASGERPVEQHYYSDSDAYYSGGSSLEVRYPPPPPPPPRPPGSRSCFAKGTLVWTKTGQRAIETLELGDLVLAQDVNSGELKYKPVMARTTRPPSPMLKLKLAGEEIHTTLGHPFWVAGMGWKMAKELGDGASLHGVSGGVALLATEPATDAEAFNLVVADFNTYFVGEAGVLVHDNTFRRPTLAIIPGLIATK